MIAMTPSDANKSVRYGCSEPLWFSMTEPTCKPGVWTISTSGAFDWRSGLFPQMTGLPERLVSRGAGSRFHFRSVWDPTKADSMARRIKFRHPVPNAQFST